MKKVYILYGRISATTDPNDKAPVFRKMLGIFESRNAAERYQIIINPLKNINIDGLEYVVEEYPVISNEEIDDLQSPN